MKSPPSLGLMCLLGALLTGFTFVISQFYFLPESDLAKQQGLLMTIIDPFVFTTVAIISAAIALLYWPVVSILLRNKKICHAALIVGPITLCAVIVAAPFGYVAGFSAALVASLSSILISFLLLADVKKAK